jgi:hypothetical protein
LGQGAKMNLFQVRQFDGKQWHVLRTYETNAKALEFAQCLTVEWDVKEVSLAEANA